MLPPYVGAVQPEINKILLKLQKPGRNIIKRYMIEEEITNNPSAYPVLSRLNVMSRRVAISTTVNFLPGTEKYSNRPPSWIIAGGVTA